MNITKPDYKDNLNRIFEGKGPTNLRMVFDTESGYWLNASVDKKVKIIEKMVLSGYPISYWVSEYINQYQSTHAHILPSIPKAIQILSDYSGHPIVKKQLEDWLANLPEVLDTKFTRLTKEILNSISDLKGFEIKEAFQENYFPIGSVVDLGEITPLQPLTRQHMGATIIDAILSAGSPYERAVRPRVEKFRLDFPKAQTTSEFLQIIMRDDLAHLLNWKGIKIERIITLSRFLKEMGVETEADLKMWLSIPKNQDEIKKLKGIKDGIVSYLRVLCGDSEMTVINTHTLDFLRKYSSWKPPQDETIRRIASEAIIESVAKSLGINVMTLDYSIWYFMSNKKDRTNTQQSNKTQLQNKPDMNSATHTLADICIKKLNFDEEIGQEFHYAHLPLCVVDAVFSIGVRYESVKNVVKNVAAKSHSVIYREDKALPPLASQMTTTAFLELFRGLSAQELAESVFLNQQRTSSTNGILKADATMQFLKILQKYQVEYLQDVEKIRDRSGFEKEITAIKGQSSGISLKYFYMLTGNDDLIKPDRMIMRFLRENLNTEFTQDEAQEILHEAAKLISGKLNREVTTMYLDHYIWLYQRSRA